MYQYKITEVETVYLDYTTKYLLFNNKITESPFINLTEDRDAFLHIHKHCHFEWILGTFLKEKSL